MFCRGLLHAGRSNTLQWAWAVIVFIETVVLGGMIFAKRSSTEKGYKNVGDEDVDPFVIGDEEEKKI